MLGERKTNRKIVSSASSSRVQKFPGRSFTRFPDRTEADVIPGPMFLGGHFYWTETRVPRGTAGDEVVNVTTLYPGYRL